MVNTKILNHLDIFVDDRTSAQSQKLGGKILSRSVLQSLFKRVGLVKLQDIFLVRPHNMNGNRQTKFDDDDNTEARRGCLGTILI